jgi:hypothetical protein
MATSAATVRNARATARTYSSRAAGRRSVKYEARKPERGDIRAAYYRCCAK